MNQQVEDTERDEIFARLKQDPNNNKCFDCEKKNPKWSSVHLGIYLCLDCAGKHREYGPQISFARSLNLDSWNRRYITFMELGGNTKALEAFKKNGLKTPYDYKNAAIQKYKQELTKKVDAALGANKAQEDSNKPVFASKPAEEEKTKPTTSGLGGFASPNVKAEKAEDNDDPFANNVILNKAETKTKGFSVEFNKNKPVFGSGNKTRLAAKKIDNVDLDSLTLNEDGGASKTNKFDLMADSPIETNPSGQSSNVKEVVSKGSSPYLKQSDQDTFKKYQNAKAISSDSFRTDTGSESGNFRQFSGASSISSSQYYGDKEEEAGGSQGIDYYQAGENIRDFVSMVGGKLKNKTENFVNKIKTEWQQ